MHKGLTITERSDWHRQARRASAVCASVHGHAVSYQKQQQQQQQDGKEYVTHHTAARSEHD